MENYGRKYNIGDFVFAHIGAHKIKGRISRQNDFNIMRPYEYFVHTIIGTFLLEEEHLFEFLENN